MGFYLLQELLGHANAKRNLKGESYQVQNLAETFRMPPPNFFCNVSTVDVDFIGAIAEQHSFSIWFTGSDRHESA
jgi:hypothetical protein